METPAENERMLSSWLIHLLPKHDTCGLVLAATAPRQSPASAE